MQCRICKSEMADAGEGEICPTCRSKLSSAAADSSDLLRGTRTEPAEEASEEGTALKPQVVEWRVHEVWRRLGEETGELAWPIAVVAHPEGGFIVLDEPEEYRISRFGEDGSRRDVLAEIPAGEEEGELEDPGGVGIDQAGRVYVADSGNDRISVWKPDGRFSHTIGEPGREHGQFARPTSVVVDDDGFPWVTDGFNRRVQRFSPDGLACLVVSKMGDTGEFREPAAISVAPDGTVYVADTESNVIVHLSKDGRSLARWPIEDADDQLDGPVAVVVDADGDVVVADRQHTRLTRFSSDGQPVARLDFGGAETELEPCGFVVRDGDVVIADRVADALIRFATEGTGPS